MANVQALATLPAGASVETGVEVGVTEKRRRNSGLVGVAQPRLVRLGLYVVTGCMVEGLKIRTKVRNELRIAGRQRLEICLKPHLVSSQNICSENLPPRKLVLRVTRKVHQIAANVLGSLVVFEER